MRSCEGAQMSTRSADEIGTMLTSFAYWYSRLAGEMHDLAYWKWLNSVSILPGGWTSRAIKAIGLNSRNRPPR